MSELEFDYEKEYVKFVLGNHLWDKKNNRLKKKVYTVLGIKNQKYDETNPHGGYYGGQHYIEFTINPPKPVKRTHCRSCFKELTDKKEQYCNRTCKQNGKELRGKWEKLKTNPKIQGIFWSEDKNSEYETIEWKDVIGVFENNGKFKQEINVITKKRHRGKPRKLKNEPTNFSKGKDY